MVCWDNVLIAGVIFLAWIIVTIWFPSICIGSLLKKMRFSERILFYQIAAVLYCTAITYILGYLHIYNGFSIVFGYFICPLIVCGCIKRKKVWEQVQTFGKVLSDLFQNRYGFKLLMHHMAQKIKANIVKWHKEAEKRGIAEILALGVVLLGVAIYFGTYKFTHYSYAAPDEEVHLYWTQALLANEFFPAGMYPFSMHSIIGLFCNILPITDVRIYLMFSIVIVVTIVFAFYVLMRKIQRGSKTALVATTVFVLAGVFSEIANSRLLYTVPMEFGMMAIPVVIIALLNLLSEKTIINKVFFLLSIAYTISAHFYTAILAAMICIGFGVVYFRSFIKKKMLLTVLGIGIGSILLSALPFGIGFIAGHEFQGSMGWAMEVMTGDEDDSSLPIKFHNIEVEYWVEEDGSLHATYGDPMDGYDGGITYEELSALQYQGEGKQIDEREYKIRILLESLRLGVTACFKNNTGCYMVLGSAILILLWAAIGHIKSKENKHYYKFCIASVFAFAVLMVFICFPQVGLPEIVDAQRIKVVQYLWYPVLVFIFLELISIYLKKTGAKNFVMVVAFCCGISVLFVTDNLQRERYVYNISNEETAEICLKIRENSEKSNYTIVSTTNEISLVRGHGYHVEWVDFFIEQIQSKPGEIYTIPTEHIYFIVEKKMMNYGAAAYEKEGWLKEYTDSISKEYANIDIDEQYLDKEAALRNAVYEKQRNVIMSKAYYWTKEYEKYYDSEFDVVYESDALVVYHLQQDMYALNNLLLFTDK